MAHHASRANRATQRRQWRRSDFVERTQTEAQSARPVATMFAALLLKLAKHLALLACLMIVGAAAGRPQVTQVGIFLTVVTAAVLHSAGRILQRRRIARRYVCPGPEP